MSAIDADDDESGEYIPTPEEIRAECLAIQSEWSDRERKRREVYSRWSVPGIRFSERFERYGDDDDEVRQND